MNPWKTSIILIFNLCIANTCAMATVSQPIKQIPSHNVKKLKNVQCPSLNDVINYIKNNESQFNNQNQGLYSYNLQTINGYPWAVSIIAVGGFTPYDVVMRK